MERVTFLIEASGERISCLLNPESVVQRRSAGLRPSTSATGIVTGAGLTDDPMIATGGGVTEIELDLLFDVDVAREERPGAASTVTEQRLQTLSPASESETILVQTPPAVPDVRELTHPFWTLSENASVDDGYGAPPIVRMIWGRAWNVLGVVVAVAERLERFTDKGVPRRSWMRLRLRRVSESAARPAIEAPATPQFELPASVISDGEEALAVAIGVAEDGLPVNRLDQIAARFYGDADFWRAIATANDIDDPLNLAEGTVLQLPGVSGGSSR